MIKLKYFILLVLFLAGCQQGSSSNPDVKINGAQGGGDTVGGGSTIGNKPVEYYAKKPDEVKAYNELVVPLIESLKVGYPRLAADFIHLAQRRTWYFIPVPLENISSQILGTHSDSDQAAIQDLGSVWFDAKIFNAMESKEQAMLLTHELVMGVRLLMHKSRQDRCFAKAALNLFGADTEKYWVEVDSCRKTYPLNDDIGAPKFIPGQINYDIIRKIVIELSSAHPNFREVTHLIEDNSVRDYND